MQSRVKSIQQRQVVTLTWPTVAIGLLFIPEKTSHRDETNRDTEEIPPPCLCSSSRQDRTGLLVPSSMAKSVFKVCLKQNQRFPASPALNIRHDLALLIRMQVCEVSLVV